MEFIWVIVGVVIGGALGWYLTKLKFTNSDGISRHKIGELEQRLKEIGNELILERDKVIQLNADLSSSETENSHLVQRLKEQNQDLEKLQEKMPMPMRIMNDASAAAVGEMQFGNEGPKL